MLQIYENYFLNILLVAVTVSDCYQLIFNFNFVANILLVSMVLPGMLVSYDASCRYGCSKLCRLPGLCMTWAAMKCRLEIQLVSARRVQWRQL